MGKNSGKDLLAIGYAIAATLAEGKDADELGVLGALFNLVGDSLSLIAARMSQLETLSGVSDGNASSSKNTNDTAASPQSAVTPVIK